MARAPHRTSNWRLLIVPALISAAIIAAGIASVWSVADHLLRDDARSTAVAWAEFLKDHVSDLDQLLETGEVSPESLAFFRIATNVGRVFRYHNFDPSGRIVLSSDRLEEGTMIGHLEGHHERKVFSQAIRDGRFEVELKEGTPPRRPSFYSEAYVPIVEAGRLQGVIEVYVDLGDKSARYWQTFGYVIFGLAMLLALAASLPGGLIWRKMQELRRAEERIRHMAHHDTLTGLPNRSLFRDRLEHAMARGRRMKDPVAVMCLDLDRFKEINDTLGHPAGDKLLKVVAERLGACIRETDTVARLGGDEFAVVQVDVAEPEGVGVLARRILAALAQPIDLDGHEVSCSGSIGIAMYPEDGDDPDRLLKNADIALYRAKADGRNTHSFFESEMNVRLSLRRQLQSDLHRALANGEFEVRYQPLLDARDGNLTGFEALLRWHHPERGLMLPLEFIPLAETSGLIKPLGQWVLQQACSEAAAWPTPLKVTVNLSPAQFHHADLVGLVEDALDVAGLEAGRLELELTERIFASETAGALEGLKRLKERGVRFSMDDFGTGYSSLSYLRRLPFDRIKIDASFVGELETSSEASTIVAAIIRLARGLGMAATAEGVETEQQLAYLRTNGCEEVQGYYFSPPIPADGIAGFLSERAPELQPETAA
jgi:diguanylate cyclase (GGDEF)-like protein